MIVRRDVHPISAIASALVVAGVVALAFAPVARNGWVDWDDRENFLLNASFRGLGPDQLRWDWTTFHLGVYQPVAWMGCGAEYLRFGLEARAFHLASLALHAINAALLCLVMRAIVARAHPEWWTRSPGAVAGGACLAAALFAAHPLRVEVVAWASAQPYLPAAGLSLLAVLAYLAAHPDDGAGRCLTRRGWLAASWCLLTLGMLAKAPAVAVAGVLPVLDVVPLRRLAHPDTARAAWREKIPFAASAAVLSMVAILARNPGHASGSGAFETPGADDALAQACYGCVFYLRKTLLPTALGAVYPAPARAGWSGDSLAVAIVATVLISIAALAPWRRLPGLAAGWVAYVILLAPNLGAALLAGKPAADRYSYFATVPLFVVLAGGLARVARQRVGEVVCWTAGLGAVAALAALSFAQSETWADSDSLAKQALVSGGPRSAEAQASYGRALEHRGDAVGAEARYREALRLDPSYALAQTCLGRLHLGEGRVDEALGEFTEVVRRRPDDAESYNNLGAALAQAGRLDDALVAFQTALRLRPDFGPAFDNLRRVEHLRPAPPTEP